MHRRGLIVKNGCLLAYPMHWRHVHHLVPIKTCMPVYFRSNWQCVLCAHTVPLPSFACWGTSIANDVSYYQCFVKPHAYVLHLTKAVAPKQLLRAGDMLNTHGCRCSITVHLHELLWQTLRFWVDRGRK